MTEIPEHLRKRAEEARKKAEGSSASESAPEAAAPASGGGDGGAASKIPEHLLQRSKSAKQREADESGGGGGTATAVAPAATTTVAAAAASGPLPTMTGPAGHTQRLLTVVKSGSIQDIKGQPHDKVHTWPHLIIVEFGAALFCTAFLTIFSIFVNAPLLRLADVNATPNPSKAPWYFLGLQEMLVYFDPWLAGVVLPLIILGGLMAIPYIDFHKAGNGYYCFKQRAFAVSTFLFGFLPLWVAMIVLGTFLRGPNWNFYGIY